MFKSKHNLKHKGVIPIQLSTVFKSTTIRWAIMVSRYTKWRYIHVPVLPEKYIELVEKKG